MGTTCQKTWLIVSFDSDNVNLYHPEEMNLYLLCCQRKRHLFQYKRPDIAMWERSHNSQDHSHSALLGGIHHLRFGKIRSKKCCGRFACVSKYSWYHIVSYRFKEALAVSFITEIGSIALDQHELLDKVLEPLLDEEKAAHVHDEPVEAVPESDSVDPLSRKWYI